MGKVTDKLTAPFRAIVIDSANRTGIIAVIALVTAVLAFFLALGRADASH